MNSYEERIERVAEAIWKYSNNYSFDPKYIDRSSADKVWLRVEAKEYIAAYLGDTVLYEIGEPVGFDWLRAMVDGGALVQVYPEVKE